MYPAPATSNPAKPSTVPSAATISCAIIFGRLAQRARQLQRDGRGQFAKLQIRRNLHRDVFDVEIVLAFESIAEMLGEPFCNSRYTSERASEILDFQGHFITAADSLSVASADVDAVR